MQAEDVSLALLVVLESLSANERIAFVLHDIFGYAFDKVAKSLQDARGRAPARVAGAQIGRGAAAALPGDAEQQRDVVLAFARAGRGRHRRAVEVLHPDVVFTSDGGGIVSAARKPIIGADRVARTSKALAAKALASGAQVDLVDINGMPGLMTVAADGTVTITSFTIDDGKIVAIDIQRNPEKLRRLP